MSELPDTEAPEEDPVRVLLAGEERLQEAEAKGRVYHVLDPDSGKPRHDLVAHHLFEEHRFATFEDTEDLLVYEEDRGVFVPAAARVKAEVEFILAGKDASRYFMKEVLGHVERRTYRPRSEFDAQPGLVVANGVLDPLTGQLGDWDPARLDTVRLPVAFDPEATCPRFLRFLRQVVSREDALVLQEGVGYCLLKGMPFHTAFLLWGDGDNGKSTFLAVVKALLGRGNVSAETLQSLSHRFATWSLVGKLANIAADLPAWPIRDAGVFKALVGNDLIRAEQKNRDAFTFTNHAKLWFSANRVPRTEDESHAYFRRWRIVPFPHTFGPDDVNPHLLEKPTVEETRDAYVRLSDPVAAFFEDRCLKDPDAPAVPKDDVYEAYGAYCRERGLTRLTKNVFVRELNRVAPWSRQTQATRGRERVRAWEGFVLASDEETESPDGEGEEGFVFAANRREG